MFLIFTGCAEKPPAFPPCFPVKGKVYVGNEILSKGLVTFYPESVSDSERAFKAVGVIESDGSFELTTQGQKGAPLGRYKATVSVGKRGEQALFASKYSSRGESDLVFEVTESPAPGAYDLKLKE